MYSKTTFILSVVFMLSFLSNNIFAETTIYNPGNKSYRYTLKIKFRKINPGKDLQYVYCPLPPSNDYQTISDIDTHGGEILDNPGSPEKYVRYRITKEQQPAEGKWGECLLEFNYTPTKSEYNAAKIEEILAYDTASDIYKTYTTKYYEFFDTENLIIRKISDSLWSESTNAYDYAKKCDNYVLDHYNFQNNPGRWNPLHEILTLDGGDCGNLSSIFITLLRCKKIPARHVIAYRHAWAEFYLEGNGWVPVDPTFRTFGKVVEGYGLIRSNEIVYILKLPDNRVFRTEELSKTHVFYPDHMPYECAEEISQRKIK